jgi:hypothetical protein
VRVCTESQCHEPGEVNCATVSDVIGSMAGRGSVEDVLLYWASTLLENTVG